MKEAIRVDGAILILAEYTGFFGQYVDIAIPENDPRNLPKAIIYNGQTHGLSGHNTDRGKAAYATGKKVAR